MAVYDVAVHCCLDNIYAHAPQSLLVYMKPRLPDDIPPGAIVSLVNRSRFVFLNNRLRPPGLPAGQFPVLMLLSQKQDFMQDTPVRHYRPDKGTIARAVRKLEAVGYIRRITDPRNRRVVRLFLIKERNERSTSSWSSTGSGNAGSVPASRWMRGLCTGARSTWRLRTSLAILQKDWDLGQ
jgi:hypothetical protein